MKLVYTVLVLAALVYAERRLIEPRLTGARLSALVQAALVYKVLVYQEWIRFNKAGFEINARPLARGEWKPRGMSRIFAQVIRRASGYFNFFCQLGVTMNETNY